MHVDFDTIKTEGVITLKMTSDEFCKTFNIGDISTKEVVIRGDAAPVKNTDLITDVTEALQRIGIPRHLKGFSYCRSAIICAVEDKNIIHSITKVLYTRLAKEYETTPSRVERAIRHGIEVAWARGNCEILQSIFGYTINSSKAKPINSEFIAMIADVIRLQRETLNNAKGASK